MNIGLDVDGVLVDTQTFQLREGKSILAKNMVFQQRIRICLKLWMCLNVPKSSGKPFGSAIFGSIA